MILLIDTSTPICKVTFVNGQIYDNHEWESGRGLAKGLLKYIHDLLVARGQTWSDISAIGVFEGPGSFTGLRIGMTVVNTIADAQDIPIVGGQGAGWQDVVLGKISSGQNEKIVLPFYGSEANITTPKK